MEKTSLRKQENKVQKHTEIENCVDAVIAKVGKNIKLGIPLGAGKPNQFVNALYERAKADPSIDLTIFSALTLEKPKGASLLEKRFMEPFAARVFEDYPDLQYELDRISGALPANVKVMEFYFPAGKFMSNSEAQRHYISSNYTHVARDLIDKGVNVVAQMVCKSPDEEQLSLSCNPDVTIDIFAALNAKGTNCAFVAQVNNNLPYMYGDAIVSPDTFHFLIDNPAYDFKLFGPPKMSVPAADYMIGLYASTLIKDGGELQVGIGSLADALIYAILLRHKDNEEYQRLIQAFDIDTKFNKTISAKGALTPFKTGLFGASEMFVDGFMFLMQNGILKRKVYDHVVLQRLLNEGLFQEDQITPEVLFQLIARGAIRPQLRKQDVDFLQHFGILRSDLNFRNGLIHFADGTQVEADLNQAAASDMLIKKGLGNVLKNGAIVHGGFFLGPTAFYDWLREMPDEERQLIHMKSVRAINQLYGHEELDRLHRKDARFFNTCFTMTLLGAAASDALEDGRVVSGVGGQYNFVDMAHALPDGHSVLQLRSTRRSGGKVHSSIVWKYGHVTIPRHLRDIVITEYGIADIRGKTDEEIVKALIQISDSRFQAQLMADAQQAGKLSADYQIPAAYQNNYPWVLAERLATFKAEGLFPAFPFGTDFTETEQRIGKALKALKHKTASPSGLLTTILKALTVWGIPEALRPDLERMQLDQPKGLTERLYQKMLIRELRSGKA